MNNRIFISNFHNIKPPIELSQDQAIAWLTERHLDQSSPDEERTVKKRFHYYSVKKEKIAKRSFAIPDIQMHGNDDLTIYGRETCDDMAVKSDFFANYSTDIFSQFYPKKNSLPDHMIHVTCTGYVSPSAPQVLVSKFAADTRVTHAYHMGCYAAFPAIRSAAGLVQSGESGKVDVVHTEACSLHMDAKTHTPEQVVIQTLFADGNIKYSLSSARSLNPSFELVAQKEMIVPDSKQDMKWELRKWGFAMTLSREVPEKIGDALNHFIDELAADALLTKAELVDKAIFAVHPGGPRIVKAVAEQFHLRDEQVYFSEKILMNRGNMSSATLPHVWEEILRADLEDGQQVVSLAFGPGLSIFGSIFNYRRGG